MLKGWVGVRVTSWCTPVYRNEFAQLASFARTAKVVYVASSLLVLRGLVAVGCIYPTMSRCASQGMCCALLRSQTASGDGV